MAAFAAAQHCDKDSCDTVEVKKKGKNCRNFDFASFNEDSPSIMFGK